MKTTNLLKIGILLVAGSLAQAGYAHGVNVDLNIGAPAAVYPYTPMPAPIVEAQPPSPGSDYVWVGGSWTWGPDNRWVWERGRWDAPHPGMHYVPNHYYERGHQHVFEHGGWRR
jgi:hypothetical protein